MTSEPFARIDDALRGWARDNRVHVSTSYKDCEVRMFELATRFGSVQIWIEPRAGGSFDAVACNNRPMSLRRLERVPVNGGEVGAALDAFSRPSASGSGNGWTEKSSSRGPM